MSGGCPIDAVNLGECGTVNTGSGIEIGGEAGQPGDTGGGGGSGDGGGGDASPEESGTDPECTRICRDVPYTVVTLPDVTATDLVGFTPARPAFSSEPEGVGVVGLPVNLVANAETQVLTGRLFDFDVSVRFTPTAYRFDYGDGSVITTSSGGTSWARAGQPQFTPTPTSHVYSSRGSFTASATVLYSAEVDFGSGKWRDVDGFVEATTGGYRIRIFEARTALVRHTCTENPGARGC